MSVDLTRHPVSIFIGGDAHVVAPLESPHNRPFRAAVDELLTRLRPGDVVALLGDLVENGFADEYSALRQILAPLRERVLAGELHVVLAVGNHDCGRLGLEWDKDAHARWLQLRQWMQSPTQIDAGARRLFVLDGVRHTPRLAHGRIGPAQRARIPGWITEAELAGRRATLLLHPAPFCSNPTLVLEDAAELMALCAGRPVDVWGAHTHHADVRVVDGVCYRTVGALCDGVGFMEIVA